MDNKRSPEYRSTQRGPEWVNWLAIPIVLIGMISVWIVSNGDFEVVKTGFLGMIFAVFCGFLFMRLTVEVGEEMLTLWFSTGWPKKRIPVREIASAKEIRNPWIVGWGIWMSPGFVRMWNAPGAEAIELTMKNGERFRFGVEEPKAVLEALERVLT